MLLGFTVCWVAAVCLWVWLCLTVLSLGVSVYDVCELIVLILDSWIMLVFWCYLLVFCCVGCLVSSVLVFIVWCCIVMDLGWCFGLMLA